MRFFSLGVVVLIGLFSSCSPNFDTPASIVQFQKDTASINSYLRANNINAKRLNSGICFIVDSAATGIRATYNDTMNITYKLKLLSDGTVAEQSTTPTAKVLSSQIGGIQIAMPYFQKGSKGRIFIPSIYGYQNSTVGSIPANSNLIYEFKLNDVKDYHIGVDTVTIDDYLSAHGIQATKDVHGLQFVIDSLGHGTNITISDSVTVNYSMSLLSGESVTAYNGPNKYLLQDVPVLAWQIALPLVPEGSFITLYVPSSLGYGPYAVSGEPACNQC
ncbi:MAG: FKBP-type peptidyl-prolyl cis-trans isomerase [Cyclobacteriaceae bacterium]